MDLLFSYLGLADFEVLYQVSKELYKLKDSFRRKHLNINTHLRDFVANPEVFRYQLGKYDALISGGFALNFFELGRWKVPNLDILIRAGNNADEFEKHIRDQEGYETDSNDNPEVETHGFQQGPFQQGAFNPFQQNQPRRNQFPWIQCHGLSSPALRHEYTLASESWRNYVMERLRRWAWVELHKVEPGKRPEQFINGIPHHSDISLPEEFQVPKTWDYADDQIPEWYREWEQMKAESGASRFRQ
ncbi:hypothetical protein DL766_001770 [Monosporascus sp. MC13-8B]|nr:hypothetical protein DL763_001473 [Monosporascus cannonballus]RYP36892.1 hypothetical protein DL766_001770 [Monosporascus sp. MC13-8B]